MLRQSLPISLTIDLPTSAVPKTEARKFYYLPLTHEQSQSRLQSAKPMCPSPCIVMTESQKCADYLALAKAIPYDLVN
jgi:hypothetical protein